MTDSTARRISSRPKSARVRLANRVCDKTYTYGNGDQTWVFSDMSELDLSGGYWYVTERGILTFDYRGVK